MNIMLDCFLFPPQTFKSTTPGKLEVTLPDKVFASILKIVPLAPADEAVVIVIEDLQIFACFEEVTETTTTTAAGITTVKSTTRFTPTEVITTTTKATPGEHMHWMQAMIIIRPRLCKVHPASISSVTYNPQ